MPDTFTKVTTPYELTVGDAVICFRNAAGNAYEETIYQCPEIKTLEVQVDASNNKIYASGKVRDVVNNVRGGTISVDVVALPEVIVKKMRGAEAQGSTDVEVSLPQLPEFGLGYWTELSDGTKKYYWHPRCKLTIGNESHATSDDGDIDPSVTYDIECMPTDEGVWKITYLAAGEHPVSLETFYGAKPYTKAEAAAIKASA